RTAILVGYPVAWIGAAVLAASATASDAAHARYLQTANATCLNVMRMLAANPRADVAQMHASVVDVERTLRVLEPPADRRAAHAGRHVDDERAAAHAAHARRALAHLRDEVAAAYGDLHGPVGGDLHVRVAPEPGARRVDRDRGEVLDRQVEPVGLGLGRRG